MYVMIIHARKPHLMQLREAAKSFFFSGPATKMGGGKGPATKEKRSKKNIFIYFSPKIVEKFFLLSKSVSGFF